MASDKAPEPQDDGRQALASTPRQSGGGLSRLTVVMGLAAILGVMAGGFAVYLNNGLPDNSQFAASDEQSCTISQTRGQALRQAAQGEVAAFVVADEPRFLPDLSFGDGTEATFGLVDWQGKTVLFNLWATWCAPCREEMPALDRLQQTEGGGDFEVVAVSIDTNPNADPRGFLDEIAVEALGFYHDPSADLFNALRREGLAFGMPTTLLFDDTGCMLGFLAGPAHWDSPDAIALIEAAQTD